MENLLSNPYLRFTLEDLLFEKVSVLEPIANNINLSATRRCTAMNQIVLMNHVLDMFEGAVQSEIDVVNKTGAQLIEEVYGKTLAELIKGAGLVTKAAQASVVAADVLRDWLNKGASWIAEKTSKTT